MAPKKNKEQALSLTAFASMSGDTGSSWADEEGEFSTSAFTSAPGPQPGTGWGAGAPSDGSWRSFNTAPAALPDFPPFTARVGNVSYDVTEVVLQDFFANEHNLSVQTVRLPRGPDGQIKGSAYVDFADKKSLEAALKLAGQTILDRRFNVQVAEHRSGPSGGPDFDWGRRAQPGEGFGSKPVGGPEDRLGRFRAGNTGATEPDLDWGSRSGAPLRAEGGFGGPRSGPHEHRPEPSFDWGVHSGPPPRAEGGFGGPRREPRGPRPEPEFDWSQKTAPPALRRAPRPERSERPERAAEPEMDWSKRSVPPAKPRGEPRSSTGGKQMNWNAPKIALTTRATRSAGASRVAAAKPKVGAPQGSIVESETPPVDDAAKREKQRISGMASGFRALQLEDDEEEEEKESAAPAKTGAASIGAIQKAQREGASGAWEQA